MKYYIIILCITILCSCVTQKRCDEKFPPQITSTTVTKDSIVCITDTMWLDPAQIVIRDSIPCPDYHHTLTQGTHHATIDIKAGHLTVTCKDDSLREIIEYQKHIMTTIASQVKVQTVTVMKTAWYYTFCVWWLVLTLIMAVLMIAWKILVNKIPF